MVHDLYLKSSIFVSKIVNFGTPNRQFWTYVGARGVPRAAFGDASPILVPKCRNWWVLGGANVGAGGCLGGGSWAPFGGQGSHFDAIRGQMAPKWDNRKKCK